MDDKDPQRSYLLTAWQRICLKMKEKFIDFIGKFYKFMETKEFNPENEDDRNNISLIVNSSLPTVIDTVVSASNGQLLLNVKSCFKNIRKLFSCWC